MVYLVRYNSGTEQEIRSADHQHQSLGNLFVFVIGEGLLAVKAWPWPDSEAATPTSVPKTEIEDFQGYEPARQPYVEIRDYLGYAPVPNNRVIGRRYEDGKLLYEVVYTIDADGLRKAPDYLGDDNAECILFFGGSFTFGEGLEDEQTIPYLVGVGTGNRYRVYNFGFAGYGTHHMLAALEHGVVDSIIECRPKYVFYQAIRAHQKRVAGIRPLPQNLHNPRYLLRGDGTPFFDGHLDELSNAPEDAIIRRGWAYDYLARSFLLKELHRATVIYAEQRNLLVAITDASRHIIESRWPGSEFLIILWNDRRDPKSKQLEWALERKRFRMHMVGDILPGYLDNKGTYRISKLDHHPNAMAIEMIADYIVGEVIRPGGG